MKKGHNTQRSKNKLDVEPVRSVKAKTSINSRRSIKLEELQPINEWRIRLTEENIFNNNYSCDVILLVESNHTLWPAIDDIIQLGETSTTVKFLTLNNLITFLTTSATLPEKKYFINYQDAFMDLQEEYTSNKEKLSLESLVYLIKLRILAYNEAIAHDREQIINLKLAIEQEINALVEEVPKSKAKSKKPKAKEKIAKTPKRNKNKSKMSLASLQIGSSKQPGVTDTARTPTIYNTDYEEPDPKNIYYVLCGISEAALIKTLMKCNITLLSLIELSRIEYNSVDDSSNSFTKFQDENELDRITSLRYFWRSLHKDNSDVLDISRQTCYIKYSLTQHEKSVSSFDDFLILLNNIADFKRLYLQYFANVRYLDVSDKSKAISLDSMSSYNTFLDLVPNECITIPLIMKALLDEVCTKVDNWRNDDLIMLNKKNKIVKKYHGGPVIQIKSLLRQYDCSHKKKVSVDKNMPKVVKVNYGDTLEYINAYIPIHKYINTKEITLDGLKKILPLSLFERINIRNTFDMMFFNYVFSKWSEQLADVSVTELTLCVYAYLFTSGNFLKLNPIEMISHLTKQNKLQQCMYGITKEFNENRKLLHVSLNKSTPDVNGGSHTSTDTEINLAVDDDNSCNELSQKYSTLAEDLEPATLIQMIHIAYNTYNHFDYKYFAPTDVILLRFHFNTNDKPGFNRQTSKYFIRTPICFRDFCYKLLLHDSEWLFNEEKSYWEQFYINRDKEKQYLMQHPKLDDTYNPEDFIIDGTFKHEKAIKNKKTEKKINSAEQKQPIPTLKTSKELSNAIDEQSVKCKFSTIHVPLTEPYDIEKPYTFEIYNLGEKYYPIEFDEIKYRSTSLSVELKKQQILNHPVSCTVLVSSQNTNLVLHCEQNVLFQIEKPIHFNINLLNGVVMVFSTPVKQETMGNRHFVTNQVKENGGRSLLASKQQIRKSDVDIAELKVYELKNKVLQYLEKAMKEKIPVFKIISSRLHKYQYVKRIKSHLALPIGNIYKRVWCKPVLYKRLGKSQNVYETKCIPYSSLVKKERTPHAWKLDASLPTGLSIQTVQSKVPQDFYVRQKYLIEREDIPSIEDEAYRCFLRSGVIMKFLKDGSIKTLSPDKTLAHYKFGYFSSNKHRITRFSKGLKDVKLKRQTNIIPLHAYQKNLTYLELKVRNICNKYKKHLIDIADNYRFERSRIDSRKLHRLYKLSKKIYTKDSHVIPLINFSTITPEGKQIDIKNNVVTETLQKYEETRKREYSLNETVTRREDGTCWMLDKKGNSITQFPDGSRIKTWFTILDENLIIPSDDGDNEEKPVQVVKIETDSLSKYCQTFDFVEDIIDDDIQIILNKKQNDQVKIETLEKSTGFVLVGMNYKFMHPHFATVSYYCWENSSADIKLPDKVKLTAYAEGTYSLNLIGNETIKINEQEIRFFVSNTDTMNTDCCCLNFGVFFFEKPRPEKPFLFVNENEERVFLIDSKGDVTNTKNEASSLNTTCDNNLINPVSERFFVMKRDFSGMELFQQTIPYRFIDTCIDLKDAMTNSNPENVVIGPTKIKMFYPLRKTYTEHLMSIYDVPILATTKERQCILRLWKIHDLDINTIIEKRQPLLIYERYINILPSKILIEELAQAVLKCVIEGNENLPNINMVESLVEVDESIEKPEISEEKKFSFLKPSKPRRLSYKCQLEKNKFLITDKTVPQYFDTVKGLMFLTVEECVDGAIEQYNAKHNIDEKKDIKKSIERKVSAFEIKTSQEIKASKLETKTMHEKMTKPEPKKKQEIVPSKKLDKPVQKEFQQPLEPFGPQSTVYPAKFNIPENLTIHLKPNNHVQEIVLTAHGLRIVTDTSIENHYYTSEENAVESITNNTAKNSETNLEQKLDTSAVATGSSRIDLNQLSSYFGEDFASHYFDTTYKISSWNDSLCQKVCYDSISTTPNTLIPEPKNNDYEICTRPNCRCSHHSIERLAACCQCHKYFCNCKEIYSPYATCAIQNELNVTEAVCVVATKIIQTFDKDASKYKLLATKLEHIMKDTANAMTLSESFANDLIKTLKWIINHKKQTKDILPHDQVIDIINNVYSSISKMKTLSSTVPLSTRNLQKLADIVKKLVCNSKRNPNITQDIIKLLTNAKLSQSDVIDLLKLTIEKINLCYEHELYVDLPIPDLAEDSKCNKIIRYVDYLIDIMTENTCHKCNIKSKMLRSNSKDTLTKTTIEPETEQQTSFIFVNEPPKSANDFSSHEIQIITEEALNTSENLVDDDEDDTSRGGFSLVKSCEEIINVSLPFISKIDSNMLLQPQISPATNIYKKAKISSKVPTISTGTENIEEEETILFSNVSSEIQPVKSDLSNKAITKILPVETKESYLTDEYMSCTILNPILAHATVKLSNKNKKSKATFYDDST